MAINCTKYNSLILTQESDKVKLDEMLSSQLREAKRLNNRPRLQLLYRGSAHKFDSGAFYKLCADKPNLICLVHSADNHVFGGYTRKGWRCLRGEQDTVRYNTDDEAFLFCQKASQFEAFHIQQSESRHATASIASYMCAFGEDGQDLCLATHCDANRESWIAFDHLGSSYHISSAYGSYLNNGHNWYRVKEVEVFQLQ
eukprot:CAMPEP_0197026320 /NCGR_PEP_ID=MMETSP1384-20130603/6434_1 /TAXON_ID=29189 /ORGANISM="Ammonia sp." /LENGTH=198 /DNA_ID=CAMNT_0042454963 /DNA_START=70 /DNA_END=666 /DNA_ORIENTATION=+